ncbi:2706_t:CDS:1, partial [Gigaspora margarita]
KNKRGYKKKQTIVVLQSQIITKLLNDNVFNNNILEDIDIFNEVDLDNSFNNDEVNKVVNQDSISKVISTLETESNGQNILILNSRTIH